MSIKTSLKCAFVCEIRLFCFKMLTFASELSKYVSQIKKFFTKWNIRFISQRCMVLATTIYMLTHYYIII